MPNLTCPDSSCVCPSSSLPSGSSGVLSVPYIPSSVCAQGLCTCYVPCVYNALLHSSLSNSTALLDFSWSDDLREAFPNQFPISIRFLCCTFSKHLLVLFIVFITILNYTFVWWLNWSFSSTKFTMFIDIRIVTFFHYWNTQFPAQNLEHSGNTINIYKMMRMNEVIWIVKANE